jgi:hypothetical protein
MYSGEPFLIWLTGVEANDELIRRVKIVKKSRSFIEPPSFILYY